MKFFVLAAMAELLSIASRDRVKFHPEKRRKIRGASGNSKRHQKRFGTQRTLMRMGK